MGATEEIKLKESRLIRHDCRLVRLRIRTFGFRRKTLILPGKKYREGVI